ncbi:MAG: hypothetical protein BroJett025_00130 [Patescibacteria group bacterium]|nr:MAG: hypothetical protein BroJett025_00130 [Patescibacteria group bacterium]
MVKNELESLVRDLVVTVEDKALLLESLTVLQELAYTQDSKKIQERIKKQLHERFFVLFETLLQNIKTPTEVIASITNLQNYITKLPIAKLTLCYSPTQEQVEQLATRIRATVHPTAIIEYAFNKDLSLSVQIDFQGKTYKRSIETTVLQ